jgi:flagellar motor switch protein FliN/FliY
MAAEWAAALAESKPEAAPTAAGRRTRGVLACRPRRRRPSFANFSARQGNLPGAGNDINMILDIPVQLTVELGRTRIPIKHILQLAQGSVVELDALAGEPMDVLVNGYLIAQGEVVVVNDKFGIRLTDIVTPSERMRRLSKAADGRSPHFFDAAPGWLLWFVAIIVLIPLVLWLVKRSAAGQGSSHRQPMRPVARCRCRRRSAW